MLEIPKQIVSGGQTGADRAALDWAIANGIRHGGWCPKSRTAEEPAVGGFVKATLDQAFGRI